jgi:hypothetical protein
MHIEKGTKETEIMKFRWCLAVERYTKKHISKHKYKDSSRYKKKIHPVMTHSNLTRMHTNLVQDNKKALMA